jgi:isoleucyl-tRNA synthetase
VDYKSTLQLPRTEFPMKADLPRREPEVIARWASLRVYERALEQNRANGGKRFLLHDGPPYANGHIHIGHVMNKVLKDVVVRFRTLQGDVAEFVPGWDCHGLPIELAVEKELGQKRKELSPVEIRRACRAYAEKFIAIQRQEFERLGIAGAWDRSYLTMAAEYEAAITRELGRFVQSGHLYRAKMPVYWCPSCATALAEAEVDYDEKDSPSIYVAFRAKRLPPSLANFADGLSVVIWTTTPWTLVANLAIALHAEHEYAVIRGKGQHPTLLVAKELAAAAARAMQLGEAEILATFPGRALEGLVTQHPFVDRESPILFGEHVTLDAGTGCVHTAPGHGHEDFELGRAHGLPPYAPIDRRGRYTAEAGEFAGMSTSDANPKIVELLAAKGALLNAVGEKVHHQYPHCWRCKKAIIFRATEQWFLSMAHEGLRQKALTEIDRVRWIPKWGRDRIYNMIENRPDWCVSRQRLWGVPIPAFYCVACEEVLITPEIVERVSGLFARESSDAWFAHTAADLLPEGTACKKCGKHTFQKENDILDVWFDSGVSYAAVVESSMHEPLPVDLYLEGNDQHRGWFHSTLLTSVGTRGHAPYKTVLTHGMVVDQQGRKMSKSQGNVVAPAEIVEKMGAEILRLWVATQDYRDDNPVSNEIIKNVSEAYRKIRNTLRFLLSNLADFEPAKHAVSHAEMPALDRFALSRLGRVTARVTEAYERYEFHRFYHELIQFCSTDLSAFYLDVTKDRLYCSAPDDLRRRATQTVMFETAETLAVLSAPVLCITAEDVWQQLPANRADGAARPASVHLASWPAPRDADVDDALEADIDKLRAIKAGVDTLLEAARREKQIGASLEAWVTLGARDAEESRLLSKYEKDLADLFVVSAVRVVGDGGAALAWEPAPKPRCERCWRYTGDTRAYDGHDSLCVRCAGVLSTP